MTSSKLISLIFDSRFSCTRKKSETIAVNVLAPIAEEELCKQLNDVSLMSLSSDAPNRKSVKLIPIMVQFYHPIHGIKVRLLEVHSVECETYDIIVNAIVNSVKKFKIEDKIISFYGDNNNTNFGGAQRRGKNNVLTKLRNLWSRNVLELVVVHTQFIIASKQAAIFYQPKLKLQLPKFTNTFICTQLE
jgi:hypothetical protein